MAELEQHLITLDSEPIFKWLDEVLLSGGSSVAFYMAQRMGEEVAASEVARIVRDQPHDYPKSEDIVLHNIAELAFRRGLGHVSQLCRESFNKDVIELHIADSPTSQTRGSFVLFLAGFWCGVALNICQTQFTFLKAEHSGKEGLTLYLQTKEKKVN